MISNMFVNMLKTVHQKNIASQQERNAVSNMLWPVSLIYGAGAFLNSVKYNAVVTPRKLPKPVVSVGNISTGGTGKTPFIIALAHKMQERNKKSAVLTRGYGSDEVRELSEHLPDAAIIVNKDRFAGGSEFLNDHGAADVFLMDDGFQHRVLYRDLNIVLINGLNPFGNRLLLPAGILREPLSALRRADLVGITHADKLSSHDFISLAREISVYAVNVPIIGCAHTPLELINTKNNELLEISELKNKDVIAFCGIGFSDGFKATLDECGACVREFIELLDHEEYTEQRFSSIINKHEECPHALLVTTEKDFMRARKLWQKAEDVWVLRIRMKITEGEEHLDGLLDRIFFQ